MILNNWRLYEWIGDDSRDHGGGCCDIDGGMVLQSWEQEQMKEVNATADRPAGAFVSQKDLNIIEAALDKALQVKAELDDCKRAFIALQEEMNEIKPERKIILEVPHGKH